MAKAKAQHEQQEQAVIEADPAAEMAELKAQLAASEKARQAAEDRAKEAELEKAQANSKAAGSEIELLAKNAQGGHLPTGKLPGVILTQAQAEGSMAGVRLLILSTSIGNVAVPIQKRGRVLAMGACDQSFMDLALRLLNTPNKTQVWPSMEEMVKAAAQVNKAEHESMGQMGQRRPGSLTQNAGRILGQVTDGPALG